MAAAEEAADKWLPIESNPAVLQAYAHKLGLPEGYSFADVLATEEWALEMVPRPVTAVFMLFPVKAASEAHAEAEAARIAREGQPSVEQAHYFCKQLIPNACGTIGIIHALANSSALYGGGMELTPDSWLARFLASTAGSTPLERAHALEDDTEVRCAAPYFGIEMEVLYSRGRQYQHFIGLIPIPHLGSKCAVNISIYLHAPFTRSRVGGGHPRGRRAGGAERRAG